jgi:hypothetical protein
MEPPTNFSLGRTAVPIILIAALAQGGALYALHRAIAAGHWPAPHLAWLLALYSVVAFVPTTLQLLADRVRKPASWVFLMLLAAALFYFGWHGGAAVADPDTAGFALQRRLFPLLTEGTSMVLQQAFVTLIWWLLVLPFAQGYLSTGNWRVGYSVLFRHAWRNNLLLAEAALFTGLFWLILLLWEMLFSGLGIGFFGDLFEKPEFIYPVTTLVFGCALHLIGSIDALVSVALEQVLNVLKWLATLASVLLIAFTIALIFKLPGLLFTEQRTISAAWLLSLVAAVVLLWNAAYQDGTVERPYPQWAARALRFCLPMAAVTAATALYALIVRAEQDGLTVLRVWGLVTAGVAVMYTLGYSIVALRPGAWPAFLAPVNVTVALVLITVLAASQTPLLSPYRLAADSQLSLILEGRYREAEASPHDYADREVPPGSYDHPVGPPFTYLLMHCGEYGRRRLQQLASLRNHPRAEAIREAAAAALEREATLAAMLKQAELRPAERHVDSPPRVADLTLYPSGRTLDPQLASELAADWAAAARDGRFPLEGKEAVGIFADLDGDGVEEFVLLGVYGGPVYQKRSARWEYVGLIQPPDTVHFPASAWKVLRPNFRSISSWDALRADLDSGKIAAASPRWQDLVVGAQRLQLDEEQLHPVPDPQQLDKSRR